MKRHTRAWIGIGTSILTGAAAAAPAQAAQPQAGAVPALELPAFAKAQRPGVPGALLLAQHDMSPEGGEGGEGGESGASAPAVSPEAAFQMNIALIRGHLSVGKELVDAGLWDEAQVHFLHPSIELYADLAEAIVENGIDPFGDELLLLAGAVNRKSGGEFRSRFDEVQAALSGAMTKAGPVDPKIQVEAVLGVLATAADEYSASLEDGKFVAVVEYQDSRGFVTVADEMLQQLQLPAEAAGKVSAAMAELKTAWPAATPPAAPVMEPGAVLASVSQIELALSSAR